MTDWEAIEREYRAGQLSVSEIGRQHGVSHTAINKRAKKHEWKRDLSKQVRQEISARLVSATVSPEVSEANAREAVALAAERGVALVRQREAVALAAERGVALVRQHQSRLARANAIAERLLEELDSGTEGLAEIEAAIDDETATDKSPQRRNAMLKAVSLPSRAATLRELSQVLKNTIPLERQAFNLDKGDDDEDGVQIVVYAEDQAV